MFQYFLEEASLLRIMQKIFDISLYEIGGYHKIMKHMKKQQIKCTVSWNVISPRMFAEADMEIYTGALGQTSRIARLGVVEFQNPNYQTRGI